MRTRGTVIPLSLHPQFRRVIHFDISLVLETDAFIQSIQFLEPGLPSGQNLSGLWRGLF